MSTQSHIKMIQSYNQSIYHRVDSLVALADIIKFDYQVEDINLLRSELDELRTLILRLNALTQLL